MVPGRVNAHFEFQKIRKFKLRVSRIARLLYYDSVLLNSLIFSRASQTHRLGVWSAKTESVLSHETSYLNFLQIRCRRATSIGFSHISNFSNPKRPKLTVFPYLFDFT
jgi:hypothetical protein